MEVGIPTLGNNKSKQAVSWTATQREHEIADVFNNYFESKQKNYALLSKETIG